MVSSQSGSGFGEFLGAKRKILADRGKRRNKKLQEKKGRSDKVQSQRHVSTIDKQQNCKITQEPCDVVVGVTVDKRTVFVGFNFATTLFEHTV